MRGFFKLICLTICGLAFVAMPAVADSEIGFWAGYGHLEKNHPIEMFRDQSRWLGRLYGQYDVLKSHSVTGGILLAWEGYHRWVDPIEIIGISSYTFKGLFLDLTPTVTVALDERRRFVLSLGAGPSGMLRRIVVKGDAIGDIPVDNEIDDALGGVAVQLTAELQELGIGLSVSGRYRFLSGEQTWKYRDKDYTSKMQIWTLRSGFRIPLRPINILIGIQAENQVAWNRYQNAWPKWPKDWEYLGYAGLSFVIR